MIYITSAHQPVIFENAGIPVELGPYPVAFCSVSSLELDALGKNRDFCIYNLHGQVPISGLDPWKNEDNEAIHIAIPKDALAWYKVLCGPECAVRTAFIQYINTLQGVVWHCGKYRLPLSQPLIMGIHNLSPDSFSHCIEDFSSELRHVSALFAWGADIVDIGAESTNPRSTYLCADEEIARIGDTLAVLRRHIDAPLSLDSYHLQTMQHCAAHIDIINDIGKMDESFSDATLRREAVLQFLASNELGYVAMHFAPHDAQPKAQFAELLENILLHLSALLQRAYALRIDLRRIVLDPGIGFGKGLQNDARLLLSSFALRSLGRPVLIGHSRKRFLGKMCGRELASNHNPTSLATLLAMQSGANIVRVHNVQDAVDARTLHFHSPQIVCDFHV